MVLLRSSGAFGGMHVKLANGLTRHNWRANALSRCFPRTTLMVYGTEDAAHQKY
jgi:hypothetical protein